MTTRQGESVLFMLCHRFLRFLNYIVLLDVGTVVGDDDATICAYTMDGRKVETHTVAVL